MVLTTVYAYCVLRHINSFEFFFFFLLRHRHTIFVCGLHKYFYNILRSFFSCVSQSHNLICCCCSIHRRRTKKRRATASLKFVRLFVGISDSHFYFKYYLICSKMFFWAFATARAKKQIKKYELRTNIRQMNEQSLWTLYMYIFR